MSTKSERILRSEMPGYWAVEVRRSEDAGPGQRYLCRADNDRDASAIASRLMGSALNVRGFSYFWIDPAKLAEGRSLRPELGASQEIFDAQDWADLLVAHKASEAAHPERGWA